MKKRVVIFGAGGYGSTLYYTLPSDYDVQFFVDNKIALNTQGEHLGLPMFNPQCLSEKHNWDLIIISTPHYISEMGHQLQDLGFKYGENFITSYDIPRKSSMIDASMFLGYSPFLFRQQVLNDAAERKIGIIFGNCQTEVILNLLISVETIRDEFYFIKIPPIFYDNCESVINFVMESNLWKDCQLFITQVVQFDNRFSEHLSSDYLCSHLNKCCRVLKIPNLFFHGYFPSAYDLPKEQRILTRYYGSTGLFANGDSNIDRMIESGWSLEKILHEIKRDDFYKRQYLIDEIEKELANYSLREREQQLDVMISDYLHDNYSSQLLFHCFRHPSMPLITELTKRIAECLVGRASVYQDNNQNFHCQNYTMLLYPSVVEQLGMKESYKKMLYYPCSAMAPGISFDEFVERYFNYRKYKFDVAFVNEGKEI